MNKLDELKRQHPRRIARGVAAFALIAAYPLWYMFAVIWRCVECLVSSANQTTQLTDVSGFVLRLLSLQHSDLIASTSQFTGGPSGDPLWRWQEFTQLPLGTLGWFYSLFLDAFTATSATTVTLWILSGCAAFLLMREIGTRYWVAVALASIFEMLPWHRINAANYLAYLMIGVALLCVAAAIRFLRHPTAFYGCLLVGMFLLSVITDGYLMFFSWFAVMAVLVMNLDLIIRIVRHGHAPLAFAILSLFIGLFIAIVFGGFALDRLQQADTVSRPLEVISRTAMSARAAGPFEMIQWSGDSPLGKVAGSIASSTAQIPYIGIVLAICAALATIDAILVRRINRRWVLTISVLALLMWTLTLPPTLAISGKEIPLPADLIRQISPGLQYFVRAGLVSQALMVVLAASFISNLSLPSRQRSGWARPMFAAVLILLIMLDLGPIAKRYVSKTASLLYPISEQIRANGDGNIFAYPKQYFGRDWLAQIHLGQPFLNARYRNWPWRIDTAGMEENSSDVRCSLLAIGAKYLLYAPGAPLGTEEFKFIPDDRIFPILAQTEISAYESGTGTLQLRGIQRPVRAPCEANDSGLLG